MRSQRRINRREFLNKAALSTLGITIPGSFLASNPTNALLVSKQLIRVQGCVQLEDCYLPDVAISDGISVVLTDERGEFELVCNKKQDFIFISLPANTVIDCTETSPRNFYHPLDKYENTQIINWKLRRTNASDNKHQILVLSDVQLMNSGDLERFRREVVPDIKGMIAHNAGLSTIVACGDIVGDDLSLLPKYIQAINNIDAEHYAVLGNHDMFKSTQNDYESISVFRQMFGPTNYSFNKGEVHYVVLKNAIWLGEKYEAGIDAMQLDWLKQDLAKLEQGNRVVVFMHIPLDGFTENEKQIAAKAQLYRILEPFEVHFVYGHKHIIAHSADGAGRHHICGAVSGAWWSGDICQDGSPNGYMIFEVDGSTISWRYKSTGMIQTTQMRTYLYDDSVKDDQIIATIWNSDETWKVYWYEDGIRNGRMSRVTMPDPLARQKLLGPDKPIRFPWIEPTETPHIYIASLMANTRQITIEAVDPFGRLFIVNRFRKEGR